VDNLDDTEEKNNTDIESENEHRSVDQTWKAGHYDSLRQCISPMEVSGLSQLVHVFALAFEEYFEYRTLLS
jgi:hypothetical protein